MRTTPAIALLTLGMIALPFFVFAQATFEASVNRDTRNEHDPGVTILEATPQPTDPESRGIEHEDIGAPSDSSESSSGGKVEATWKVEEGEKSTDDSSGTTTRMNKADLIETLHTQGAVFVKLGDIKGESDDTAKKPKEIVVVGSKVRGSAAPLLQLPIAKGKHLDDTSSTTPTADVFFDIAVIIDDEDAELLAAAVVQSDENIKEATLTDTDVSIEYETLVRLFGFIPINTTQTATVELNEEGEYGRVKVKMPWWHALGRKTVRPHDLEVALEEELEAQYNESDLNFLQERARTLQTISNVMKALNDTAMSVIRKIG